MDEKGLRCSLITQRHLSEEITFDDLLYVLLWAVQVAYNIGKICPLLHDIFIEMYHKMTVIF